MKKKLDLNHLLEKYEGITGPAASFQSPARQYELRENAIEQEFYQSNTYQKEIPVSNPSKPITGNFQMSKSECEQFLVRVKDELRNEERGITSYTENTMKHVHERFKVSHEKIKREILDLLERSFQQNERQIIEQLKRQGNIQPPEFMNVHKKITLIDEEVNRLLYGLKGHQYRKSIAEVVMKDFQFQITDLREQIKIAKENYLASLGEIEPDLARVENIRTDLQHLFRLNKRTANLVQNSLFSVIQDKFQGNEKISHTMQPQIIPKEKTRKSFFNFGSD